MANNPLNTAIFQDATKAREWLEGLLWSTGRCCGYCGALEASSPIKTRPGYYQCNACRKQFTVMVGTVFERSHIPLNKWLQAAFILSASKKGMSAHQMSRMLGITYKSTWFMCHRLREAMKDGSLEPMGGAGKHVEADETYIGTKANTTKRSAYHHKMAVVSLVERGGRARSFHVDRTTSKNIAPLLAQHVSIESTLNTDEAEHYRGIGKDYAVHQSVSHARNEYVKGTASTNTIEGFFSIFKRGMKGVYQHCSEEHLHRYLAEFDFRYSNRAKLGINDSERTVTALKGIVGKRLTYRRINERTATPSLGN
jgi:transposase-like protein